MLSGAAWCVYGMAGLTPLDLGAKPITFGLLLGTAAHPAPQI